MDRPELEHLLEQVSAEEASVERHIAALQARLTALTTTAGGLQALLETASDWEVREDPGTGNAVEAVSNGGTPRPAPSPQDSDKKAVPRGKTAARLVLQSDPSRYWSVREVWEEIVRRGWAEARQRGRKGNPPARIALMRVQEDAPENVLVIDSPVLSYKWTSTPAPSSNGSGASHTEEERGPRN